MQLIYYNATFSMFVFSDKKESF